MEDIKNENSPVEFRIEPLGPIYAKGKFKLIDSHGNVQELNEAYLCRCGRSKNKPFCDGSHKK